MKDASSSVDRPAWGWIALTVVGCAVIGVPPQLHAFEVIGIADAPRAALWWQLGMAMCWAVLAVPLARRWSLADHEGRALVGLGLLAIAISVVSAWAAYAVLRPSGAFTRGVMIGELVSGALPTHALTASLLSLVGSWTNGRRQRRRAADREAMLSAHATRAELTALRERVQPHFVLNALNTITALGRRGDGDHAAEVATDLGELLQFSLSTSSDAVGFDAEQGMVQRYLAIEQARFGSRLEVLWEIEPGARTTLVPALSWQPVVENAVRHGVSRRAGGSRLRLAARRDETHVVLSVEDEALSDEGDPRDRVAADALGGLGIGDCRFSTAPRLRCAAPRTVRSCARRSASLNLQ
jgi:hypothetical protein